jgi:hypothetical protein
MYVKASVKRPSGTPGKGITLQDQMIIIDVDDVQSFPSRNAAGVVIEGDMVMKAGKYAVGLYMTPGTTEVTSNSDGDTDAEGFKPQVKFAHPGNEQEVREFKANWLGKKCVIIMRYCNGKLPDLIGSPCNPVKLTVAYTGSNDANKNELTFEQISKGDDIAIYSGSITLEEPVAVVATGATAVPYSADGQYQLTAGAASIASVTGGVHGSAITLLGVSGVAPTIAKATEGSEFVLKSGKTFVASDGSQITFKAFDDGGITLKWIEVSRYEA